ncbi:uncharacterized protein (DUF305 family) [Deinococcus sp. HSC-46F16]|uniref:DUF305 domain-containing protein n=1 Tax=Deinococcus sp. HSC-46F16 TaxID=2910968 RepID=UPI00209E2D06|nr:DUF305 domain-containing protein [Deinococcus sp. HSC-46F16]MCP2013009.1 uncharacterized protein (DUF305 family) [Deinococcus sp. HSC-46F16]
MTRRPALIAALALAAALLAVALALTSRSGTPAESSTEVRFVREMTQHHAQAVDMATRLRERTDDRTLRSLTLDIVLSQQEQIGQMRGWLTLWGLPWGGEGMSAEHARRMGMATPEELNQIDTLPVQGAEAHFLRLMIRHHQGALSMVEPALGNGIRPEVRTLARQIQATQGGEIRLMEDLLRQRGEDLPPPPDAAQGGAHEHH